MPPSEATSQYPPPDVVDWVPLPDIVAVRGLPAALSVRVREADRGPVVVGVKATATEQLEPSATVLPEQVSPVMVKSFGFAPPMVAELTLIPAPVMLVREKLVGLLALPTGWLPKAALAGPKVGCADEPTPVRMSLCGVALSAIDT